MRGDFTISLLCSQEIKLVCGCLEHLCGPQLSLAGARQERFAIDRLQRATVVEEVPGNLIEFGQPAG